MSCVNGVYMYPRAVKSAVYHDHRGNNRIVGWFPVEILALTHKHGLLLSPQRASLYFYISEVVKNSV